METIATLYDLSKTYPEAKEYLEGFTYPWEALKGIKDLIVKIGESLPEEEFEHPSENVWIAKDATIFPTAYIGPYTIIGHETEVRQCAFVRGNALVGNGVVVGNSTELKNVILFDNVQVPHYNYVGDSLLGHRAHMGAGAVTSNVKSDRTPVKVRNGDDVIETYLKKMGAILGDFVEVGCNSVLNPGTVICPRSNVYPLSSVRGVVPPDSILKSGKGVEIVGKE